MADINALIAQGVNPVQIESPINQMGKIMSIRNAQQEYSMNEQKLADRKSTRLNPVTDVSRMPSSA